MARLDSSMLRYCILIVRWVVIWVWVCVSCGRDTDLWRSTTIIWITTRCCTPTLTMTIMLIDALVQVSVRLKLLLRDRGIRAGRCRVMAHVPDALSLILMACWLIAHLMVMTAVAHVYMLVCWELLIVWDIDLLVVLSMNSVIALVMAIVVLLVDDLVGQSGRWGVALRQGGSPTSAIRDHLLHEAMAKLVWLLQRRRLLVMDNRALFMLRLIWIEHTVCDMALSLLSQQSRCLFHLATATANTCMGIARRGR